MYGNLFSQSPCEIGFWASSISINLSFTQTIQKHLVNLEKHMICNAAAHKQDFKVSENERLLHSYRSLAVR